MTNKEDLARFLGSFPMHEDDRGPDNTVLVDLLPFTPGEEMGGETVLYRIVDALIERFPALLREAGEPSPSDDGGDQCSPDGSLATAGVENCLSCGLPTHRATGQRWFLGATEKADGPYCLACPPPWLVGHDAGRADASERSEESRPLGASNASTGKNP